MLNETDKRQRKRKLDEFVGWRTSSTIRNRMVAVAKVKGVTTSTLMTMLIVGGLDTMQKDMITP